MQSLHDFSWLKNKGERRNTFKHLQYIHIGKYLHEQQVVGQKDAEENSNLSLI